jgi:hypothetical protein
MAQRLNSDRRQMPVPPSDDPTEVLAKIRPDDLRPVPETGPARPAAPRPIRENSGSPRPANGRQPAQVSPRNRRLLLVAMILIVAAALGVGIGKRAWNLVADGDSASGGLNKKPGTAPSMAMATAGAPTNLGPARGTGAFSYVTAGGEVHGGAGSLKKYKVAVENGSDQNLDAFAEAVEKTLGDPRGWAGGGAVKLQRVSGQATADFTIFLTTPVTSESMCATGGLHTDKYTSCRLPGKIIINLERWLGGVPDYGAKLDVYQAYAINHELGHELGRGHEACPAAGQPAPVMQQQTLGLRGCTANAWPFLNNGLYEGPKVP